MRSSDRLVAVLFGVVSACTTQERPPPAGDCAANGCITKGPQNTSSSGSSGTGDDGGTPVGSMQPDAGLTRTLSGTVGVLENEQFATQTEFDGTGTVGGEAPAGRVTADFTGSTFSLPGVLRDAGIWVDLQATATTLDVMGTLARIDASGGADGASGAVQLVFVRTATVENVGAGLLSPVTLDPSRGHAVVTFVDASGNGVSGVVITSHTGEAVAYDTGTGVYRDDQPQTTSPGRAIVLNAQAIGFPGAVTRFSYTASGSDAFDVKLAAGAVTLLTVLVP